MEIFYTVAITIGILFVIAIVLGVKTMALLITSPSINLVGGKLENSNESIEEACLNLKVTNEYIPDANSSYIVSKDNK